MTADRKRARFSAVSAAGVVAVSVAGCQAFLVAFGGALVEARAVELFEEVRSAAEEFVGEEPPELVRPFLLVLEAERMISLNRGVPRRSWSLGFESDDPWQMPFAAQVETELLRRIFRDAFAEEPFWERPLAQADTVVIRALRDILEEDDAVALAGRLEGREAELVATRERLEANASRFAQERGFEFVTGGVTLGPPRLQVPVSTQPEGGIVRMLKRLVFRKEEIRGVPPDRMPWQAILQSPADLVGIYEFWVSWPATGQEARGRIHVRSDAPLLFGPDSAPDR